LNGVALMVRCFAMACSGFRLVQLLYRLWDEVLLRLTANDALEYKRNGSGHSPTRRRELLQKAQ